MGRIKDWSKVLTGVEYLDFQCVLLFLPFEEINERSFFEKKKDLDFDEKRKAFFRDESEDYYKEASKIGKDEILKGFIEENLKLENFKREISEIEFLEKGYKTEKISILKSAEEEQKIIGKNSGEILLGDERMCSIKELLDNVWKLDGKREFGEGEKEIDIEEKNCLSRVKVQEIIKDTSEKRRENTRMEIEVRREGRDEEGEDIDRIADLLTMRLCEMMQTGAEGFYV